MIAMKRLLPLLPALLCSLLLAIQPCDGMGRRADGVRAGESTEPATPEPTGAGPLYVSIVVHAEEDTRGGTRAKDQVPDYDGSAATLTHFTAAMRAFAETCAAHGAHLNFGTDWTFADGVAAHDPSFFADLEQGGHEIDAHAHETAVSYHELRGRIEAAGGHPTAVASGMREDRLEETLRGFEQHPGEFRVLWGIAHPGHARDEVISGWVWRPSRSDWLTHDPDGAYVCVGHGELINSADAVRRAAEARRDDRIESYALFASPRDFKASPGARGIDRRWTEKPGRPGHWESRVAWWDDLLDELDVLVAEGAVQYATLTEIAAIYEAAEPALAFPTAEEHPRSSRPRGKRNREAGYLP